MRLAENRCCPFRSEYPDRARGVNVPLGSLTPNMSPVDISLKKPVYMPMISMSPTSVELNGLMPAKAPVSVVKVRLVVGIRTITPQSRLKLYWKPTLYHWVLISLSELSAAGARELPT